MSPNVAATWNDVRQQRLRAHPSRVEIQCFARCANGVPFCTSLQGRPQLVPHCRWPAMPRGAMCVTPFLSVAGSGPSVRSLSVCLLCLLWRATLPTPVDEQMCRSLVRLPRCHRSDFPRERTLLWRLFELEGEVTSAGGSPAVAPSAREPSSPALVVEAAEAVAGAGGGLHGPVEVILRWCYKLGPFVFSLPRGPSQC